MLRMTLTAAPLLALIACASEPTLETLASTCQAYGYQPGTEQMAQCMQLEMMAHRQAAADRSARTSAAGAAMVGMSRSMSTPPPPPRQPVYCQPVGNGVSCY